MPDNSKLLPVLLALTRAQAAAIDTLIGEFGESALQGITETHVAKATVVTPQRRPKRIAAEPASPAAAGKKPTGRRSDVDLIADALRRIGKASADRLAEEVQRDRERVLKLLNEREDLFFMDERAKWDLIA